MRETSSIFSKVFTVSTKRSNCRVGKSARVSLRALSSTSACGRYLPPPMLTTVPGDTTLAIGLSGKVLTVAWIRGPGCGLQELRSVIDD